MGKVLREKEGQQNITGIYDNPCIYMERYQLFHLEVEYIALISPDN